MSSQNRLYTERLGLVSVIVLSNQTLNVKGKLNIIEDIICFKTRRPYRMLIRLIENKRLGFVCKVESSKEISEDEYKQLRDTPLS